MVTFNKAITHEALVLSRVQELDKEPLRQGQGEHSTNSLTKS